MRAPAATLVIRPTGEPNQSLATMLASPAENRLRQKAEFANRIKLIQIVPLPLEKNASRRETRSRVSAGMWPIETMDATWTDYLRT